MKEWKISAVFTAKRKVWYLRSITAALLAAACLFLCTGCSVEKSNRTKVSDLEYVIVAEEDIPEELKQNIEEKKNADFKMTYETEADLYIVHGYGEQATGGYSIRIRELYLTSNAIFFSTELIGPRKGENITKSPSFPYIVVRTPLREESVIFD